MIWRTQIGLLLTNSKTEWIRISRNIQNLRTMYCACESPSVFGVFFFFTLWHLFSFAYFLDRYILHVYADRKQQIGSDTLTYLLGILRLSSRESSFCFITIEWTFETWNSFLMTILFCEHTQPVVWIYNRYLSTTLMFFYLVSCSSETIYPLP